MTERASGYKIAKTESGNLEYLETVVNQYMRQGWRPIGGPSAVVKNSGFGGQDVTIMQAVVKP